LDATFFAHQEEIDLCWRLRSRGYRMVCTPQSVVYHVGGATLNTESPHKTFLNFRNNLLMLYKNLPDEELGSVMRIRFWLDYLAALRFLLSGHPQNAKAVYDARKAFFHLKPEYVSLRRENLQKTSNHSIPEILRKSLLIAFYLKGRKTFKALPGFKPSQAR
jgi:GT2 family glycosyltransferase